MTPAEVRADYRASMNRVGWTVKLRRMNPSAPPTEIDVLARIIDFKPNELVSGMKQGSRKAIVLAEDVEGTAFALPFKTGGTDKIVDGTRVLNIDFVDDSTRRIQGVFVAYEITVTG